MRPVERLINSRHPVQALEPPPKDDSALIELAKAGADIVSRVAGASIGLAIGGETGTIIGAAAGPAMSHTLRKVGAEIKHGILSRREESRVGAVFLLACEETEERLDAGEQIRQDEFFNEDAHGRSTAEEITEGVFRAAQREYEERKIPFLASLLSGLAFDGNITRSQAVALIRTAEALSYRQLCLAALYARVALAKQRGSRSGNQNTDLIPKPVNTAAAGKTMKTATVVSELSELASRGLVLAGGTYGGGQVYFGDPPYDRLTVFGEKMYLLLGLERIPREDVDAVLSDLLMAEFEAA